VSDLVDNRVVLPKERLSEDKRVLLGRLDKGAYNFFRERAEILEG